MILETERLVLRPWEESDAESLYEYAKDERVGPAAGWLPHTGVENSREVIRLFLSAPETYAVCLKTDNRAIGSIGLMIGKSSNLDLTDTEGEIGYWIGVPFWGKGLIPEATRELMRHAFCDLHLETLWCGYFDGNEKSKRVQEKCGFLYHHTNRDVYWKLMDVTVTQHIMRLDREEWRKTCARRLKNGVQSDFTLVKLSERQDLLENAAAWFHEKWSIPQEAYKESMEASFSANGVPTWYLCMENEKIVAGMGVIENDFHPRKDLTPNVCAVYTEEAYRGRGIAGELLNYVSQDMAAHGIDTLYLLTDHTGFYERYGWKFLCMVQGDGEETLSRMYIHQNLSGEEQGR